MISKFVQNKFTTLPYQNKVVKPWGYEIVYTRPTALAVGKILHVRKGKRLSLQYHDQKIETLCLVKGKAQIVIADKKGKIRRMLMRPFMGYLILPGQVHRVSAITDVDFIEASTAERGNTFRLEDDAKRPTETEILRRTKNRGWQCRK